MKRKGRSLLTNELEMQADPPRVILPEILGEIFAWVIPRTPLSGADRDQLLYLTLVCKAWRTIALHTHQLWGRVEVPIGRSFDYDKVIAWLSKAGMTHKVVSLVSYNRYNFQDPCPCGQLGITYYSCHFENASLVRFFTSGPPLDHLTLPTSPSSCFEHLICKIKAFAANSQSQPWNSIRSITLSFGRGYYVEPIRTSGSIFNSLPSSLTSLDLTFASSDNQPRSRYEIPSSTLERLKSLRISCHWDVARLADLLRRCTKVECLGVSHRSGHRHFPSFMFRPYHSLVDDEHHIPSPTLFHHLRSLDVDIRDPLDAAHILRQINAPALLDVSIHNDDSISNISAVYNYLDYLNIFCRGPAPPSIRSLTIYERFTVEPSKIIPTMLMPILSKLTSLTHLGLVHVTFDANKFLHELRTTYRGLHIAPQLRTIGLTSPGNDITLKALLGYVQERCNKSTGPGTVERIELRSVQLRLVEEYHHDNSSIVQAFQDLGVVVDIYL